MNKNLRNKIVGGLAGVLALVGCEQKTEVKARKDIFHNTECTSTIKGIYNGLPDKCRRVTDFIAYRDAFVVECDNDPVCKIGNDGMPQYGSGSTAFAYCINQESGYISPKKIYIACHND